MGSVQGSPRRLAGLDLEAAAMERAFDDVAVDFALGEPSLAMGTGVVGGVEGAVQIVDRDWRQRVGLDPQNLARVDVIDAAEQDLRHRPLSAALDAEETGPRPVSG